MKDETQVSFGNHIAIGETITIDCSLRGQFRAVAARLDGMTEGEAHNALWDVWYAHRPTKADQARAVLAKMDGMTDIELWHALSAIIVH